MRPNRHYWMAYALFILIPVGILMLVSGYVADWQVRNRSQELSSDLTAHVNNTLDEAESLEIRQVFVLTYQAAFFRKFGFKDTDKQNLPHKIWSDCLHCAKFPDCDEDALIRIDTAV